MNLSSPSQLIYVPLILAVSFAIYYVGFWGAGDGKLYVCCATYLLPSISDGLYAAAAVLLLSVTLCYFAVFLSLLHDRRGRIMRLFREAATKTLSKETALRLLLSFCVVAAASLTGFGEKSRLAALIILYVLSSVLPPAASLAVVLLLLPLMFFYGRRIEEVIMLLPAMMLFAFFFAFYSALARSYGGRRIVFAPFLMAAALLIMLLP